MWAQTDRINKYIESLERVSHPVNTTNFDTCTAYRLLTSEGHFLELCNSAFGPLATADTAASGGCWVDAASQAPSSSFATALFYLLKPTGPLHLMMEYVSAPSAFFTNRLRDWMHPSEEWQENDPSEWNPTFEFPLSAICAWALEMLREDPSTSPVTLPRERFPPLLLLPFWRPPLGMGSPNPTGVSPTLSCTMLGYFILRMVLFLRNRSTAYGLEIVQSKRAAMWASSARGYVSQWLHSFADPAERPSSEVGFCIRLISSYFAHYATPSTIERCIGKRPLTRSWNVEDCSALQLFHVFAALLVEYYRPPPQESLRISTRDSFILAPLFLALPMLRSMWRSVVPRGSAGNLHRQFSDFGEAAWADVSQPHRAVFRWGLLALRECFGAYATLSDCDPSHLVAAMQLWHAMLEPPTHLSEQLGQQLYITQHYEVYSFLWRDVLTMLHQSHFLLLANIEALEALQWGIKLFRHPAINPVLGLIGAAIAAEDAFSPEIELIHMHYTIRWTSAQNSAFVASFGNEVTEHATRAVAALAKATSVMGPLVEPSKCKAMNDIRDLLRLIFPQIPEAAVAVVESPASVDLEAAKRQTLLEHLGRPATRVMTPGEHGRYLQGSGNSCDALQCRDLRFGPRTRSSEASMISPGELPSLLYVTSMVDGFIEWAQKTWYHRSSPRCSRGHILQLSGDGGNCFRHSTQLAVWRCRRCLVAYCLHCFVMDHDRAIEPIHRQAHGRAACDRCAQFLRWPFSFRRKNGAVWCPDCANAPWPLLSTRFLAHQTTLLVLSVATLFLAVFYQIAFI